MLQTQQQLTEQAVSGVAVPKVYLASGLHPAYISEHTEADLEQLAQFLQTQPNVAVGDIGLDTFTDDLKTEQSVAKQKRFFEAQLDFAVEHP